MQLLMSHLYINTSCQFINYKTQILYCIAWVSFIWETNRCPTKHIPFKILRHMLDIYAFLETSLDSIHIYVIFFKNMSPMHINHTQD
jgi:hypothetical protein